MTAKRIKRERMRQKHEQFMLTVKEGNLSVLNKVRDQREEERKRAEKELKDKKIAKSKQLAAQNGATPKNAHKPMPKKARKAINKKKEN